MYQQHFGIRELPFNLSPDTSYYYNYASHQEALNVLLIALNNGEGFVKVTGEVGTGKTLLCRKLLNTLDDNYVTTYIPNPTLSPIELREALADELGIRYEKDLPPHRLLKLIYARLATYTSKGKRVVLMIDEAQAMPASTLEALRLLTNLETEKRKLLQVILFGQQELDDNLNAPSARQLKQRITFTYHLRPINPEDVAGYLYHRLNQAGYNRTDLFSHSSVKLLAKASHGVPRVINILAHKAMMSAYGQGLYRVERKHVRDAVKDTQQPKLLEQGMQMVSWRPAVSMSLTVALGVLILFAGSQL